MVMNKALQILKLKEFITKKGLVADTIDFEAEVDSKLSFVENKFNLLKGLNLSEDLTKKQIDSQIQLVEIENVKKIEEIVKEETKQALDLISEKPNALLLPQLQSLSESVDMVIKGHFSGMICVGRGGISKSWTIINALAKSKTEYILANSHLTPLALYSFLYKNNGKVILIEDAEQIFSNTTTLSILRSATWGVLTNSEGNQIRTITYYSTSKEMNGLPSNFIFSGKIILVFNSIPSNNEFDALASRLILHKMDFSLIDIKKALLGLAQKGYKTLSKEECITIANQVIDYLQPFHKNLNLRLLLRCFEYYLFDKTKWFQRLKDETETDELMQKVIELIKSAKSNSEQIELFFAETGFGRTTFFKKKREYLKLLGGSQVRTI